ncbi:MAG TPA: ABC transporter permease [Nitriliruptoraceae bacterium]|nr:ABC transporter permease [Nitriliruptoraceae bacterium]
MTGDPLVTRARRFGTVAIVLGVFTIVVFAIPNAGVVTTLSLESRLAGGAGSQIGSIDVPVLWSTLVLGLGALALGVALWMGRWRDHAIRAGGAAIGLFVIAFLLWAARGETLFVVDLARLSLRAAVPLTLGALAGVVSERAGVVNIAIEGQLLMGAFMAAVLASVTESPMMGTVAAILGGVAIAAMLGLLSVKFDTDQIVAGVVLIVFATGLTSFLASQWLTVSPDMNSPATFSAFAIPGLSSIPILGPILFDQSFLVYVTLAAVIILQYGVFNTRWGLRLRSVGEHPKAADTVGINVPRTRWLAVLLGGALAGMGGAFLSIDAASSFTEEMSGGKGFIALAAMLAGRYNPRGAFGAALVFGLSEASARALQGFDVGIPSTLLLATPYVVTILVVSGLIGRLRIPGASAQHYSTE